ncbi:hypothetical protein [Cyanobacterium aponinum]|uniref:Uncharacterized protein n=1 Tax=Cyanobacterium aponinum (strain PCC 10605) TaxID=755178 RepID=K9Z594_CYAAP|nr:hypothetical protein [Cyanobacterium aponinum]AFZ53720.1 hypothetical protein Cyan10605_1613 [Cyanobacterium aponinum PCC 10605]
MKINWFSPLPPANSDITNYTIKLLTFLQEKAEITFWTNQSPWDAKLKTEVAVKEYKIEQISWLELNQGDVNIYHIGNNAELYGDIWQISRRFPGIVILHDEKLQDFFYMLSSSKNEYIEYMKQCYGEEGNKNARLFLNNYHSREFMAKNYPLTPLALENALGVITYNYNNYLTLSAQNRIFVGYMPSLTNFINTDNNINSNPLSDADALINFASQVCQYRCQSSLERIVNRIVPELTYLNPKIETLNNFENLVDAIEFITLPVHSNS